MRRIEFRSPDARMTGRKSIGGTITKHSQASQMLTNANGIEAR